MEREHGAERRLSLPQRSCAKTTPKRCSGGFSVAVVVVVIVVAAAVVVYVVVIVFAYLKLSLP